MLRAYADEQTRRSMQSTLDMIHSMLFKLIYGE